MVLPHRIELWTSPLPRECSTTELRQRRRRAGREPGPAERRGKCHTGVSGARIGDGPEGRNLQRGLGLCTRDNSAAAALRFGPMTQGKSSERERRAERLAAALKENLKRRKAQARGRAGEEAPKPRPEPPEEGGEA
jgi:hypothetical protein